MKKTGVIFCITGAVLFLVNASVWEGSASASTGGDLPETGYFAATNSFPRNTVADVTNLENGRTVRVIVAGSLDTPGLLVVLSRDAADAIGLQPRFIGRVRMNQPADPVAFSRFSEGLGSSGDPDHDPAALVAAEGLNPDLLEEEETEAAGASVTGGEIASLEPGPELVWTPPEEANVPETASETTGSSTGLSGESSEIIDEGVVPEPGPELVWMPPEETGTPETTGNSGGSSEIAGKGVVPEPGPELAWTSPEETNAPEIESADPALDPGGFDFALEPAETRVPGEPPLVVNPSDIIASVEPAVPPERDNVIDPAYIIPPVKRAPSGQAPVSAPPPVQSAGVPGHSFSAPVISSLEKGRYYVQVAALSKPESVETEITKIGRTWPLAVQRAGSAEKPVYRVLIGPVNLGESGALLQRFKTTYKDAFVRLGN
jgi:hypothetical protein